MPLFHRSPPKRSPASPPSKANQPTPSLPPPTLPSLGSPFQLSLPSFASSPVISTAPTPGRSDSSDTGTSVSTVPSTTPSLDTAKLTSPTSEASTSKWSLVDAVPELSKAGPAVNGDAEEEAEEKEGRRSRKNSAGSAKLKGFFRRRSGSKGSVKEKDERGESPKKPAQGRDREIVPPVPSLPPTLGLFELPSTPFTTPPQSNLVSATRPVQEQSIFADAEGEDLASLLHLVHAAGDKAIGSDEGHERYRPSPPENIPPVSPGSDLRTPELAASSAFSSPSSDFSSPSTPKPLYSFLSHIPATSYQKKAKFTAGAILSPYSLSGRSTHSLLTPPTTPPAPSTAEDDYGAASDPEEDEEDDRDHAWGRQVRAHPTFARRSRPPPLLVMLSPHSSTLPKPSRSPRSPALPRSARPRPLGPRATQLLSLTVGRLSPSPSSSSSSTCTLESPLSTHSPSAAFTFRSSKQVQPLRKTLGRLALLRKLKRGTTMLEAMEVERSFSSSSSSFSSSGAKRSSVISKSARLSMSSFGDEDEDEEDREGRRGNDDGSAGRRSLEMWELEHGKLDKGATLRAVLSPVGGDFAPATPPPSSPSSPSSSSYAVLFPRLSLWVLRPAFQMRMLETRRLDTPWGGGGGSERGMVVEDVVRPSRVGSGRVVPLKLSARVRGMLAGLEVRERGGLGGSEGEGKREDSEDGLLNPVAFAVDGEISPSLRAAAEGASRPPEPFSAEVSRKDGKKSARLGGMNGRSGPRKLLLPGPLLLKALAEDGEGEEEALETQKQDDDSDEDDQPLFHLQQKRVSFLPTTSRSSSRLAKPPTPPAVSQTALLRAQQKAAKLEEEVQRLKAKEREAKEREEQMRWEQQERDEQREREVKEKEAARRMTEQRRRSQIMSSAAVRRGRDERRTSTLPPPHASQPTLHPSLYAHQSLLAVPQAQQWMVPVPVAVPVGMGGMPFYQMPLLSSSAPDLQPQQHLLPPGPQYASPPRSRTPSPSGLPRTASRQSLLPPSGYSRAGTTPLPPSPHRQPSRQSLLQPASVSPPHAVRNPSPSPALARATPSFAPKRQSSFPSPSKPPHSNSSSSFVLRNNQNRLSTQPFLVDPDMSRARAVSPAPTPVTGSGRSQSAPFVPLTAMSPQKRGPTAGAGGSAFLRQAV
ncbi:hypothetical protein JCM11641_004872 [Rhodosporidiobolus odoratus]